MTSQISETKSKTDVVSIHPATLIGQVSLSVSNLESQINFYQQVLGFNLNWREENQAGLGTENKDLLRLVEQPSYKRYQRITGFNILETNTRSNIPGLYKVNWILLVGMHLHKSGYPFPFLSSHVVDI